MPPQPTDFAAALAEELERGWSILARPNQLPPSDEGDWFIWLLLAGRGFGKTRSLTEFVLEKIAVGAASRVALVAPTAGAERHPCLVSAVESAIIRAEQAPPNLAIGRHRHSIQRRRTGAVARPAA